VFVLIFDCAAPMVAAGRSSDLPIRPYTPARSGQSFQWALLARSGPCGPSRVGTACTAITGKHQRASVAERPVALPAA
jgi:hypothetical protein